MKLASFSKKTCCIIWSWSCSLYCSQLP
uniref:Uncharacterized protein n=1 Tax=Arundo donax TaxID=35708 RepID=A0A0A9B896_ARUDO